MAFGVLPPFSPTLVTKSFFDSIANMEGAHICFDNIPPLCNGYSFALQVIGADHRESLCNQGFCILGTAGGNHLYVPANVASDYLHAIRVIQGIVYGYGWPYSGNSVKALLEDDEYHVLILLFGLMYDLPGAASCLNKMRAAGSYGDGQTLWETEVVGELQPTIEKLSCALGEIIRNDCRKGASEATLPERYLKILAHYERAFVLS